MAIGTAALIGYGITAGVGAYGAHKASSAAKKAAELQAGAANQATELQRDIYTQGRQDTMPWLRAGQSGVSTLAGAMGLANPSQGPYAGGGMTPGADDWSQYLQNNPDVAQHYYTNQNNIQSEVGSPEEWAQRHYYESGQNEGRQLGTPQQPGGGQGGAPGSPGGLTAIGGANTTGQAGTLGSVGDGTSGGGDYPLASMSGTGLMRAWDTPFNAPDPNKISEDPSYQWRMNEGTRAVQSGAAAKGNLLTGGTLKDLTAWSQGLASQEYDKIYNRGLGEYRQAYDIYGQNQANQFNRLSSLAGLGQTANAQSLTAGANFGQNASQNMQSAANVTAAGQMAGAGAWGGYANTLGNIGQDVVQHYPFGGSGGRIGVGWGGQDIKANTDVFVP